MNYEEYFKVCQGIPDYLKKKLEDMPNNKGYIWKGVCLFGGKAVDDQPKTTLFEKDGNTMFIHEWTKTEYFLFSKEKDQKRILVKKQKRWRGD